MSWTSSFVVFCVLVAVDAQTQQRQNVFPRNRAGQNANQQPFDPDYDVIIGDEIPGIAGVDYPVLSVAPRTDFTCDLLNVPGYYADQQTGCQVYYRCQDGGRGVASLCPNGTLFNQQSLVCEWWYNVDCSRAADYYNVNEEVVRAMEAVDTKNALTRRPFPSFPPVSRTTQRVPTSASNSRLRNPALNNPFDRRPNSQRQSPFGGANPFGSPARYSQDGSRDSENSSSDRNNASQKYNDSTKGKNNDKEFEGYSYPNPKGIDRSYLPPTK